MRDWTYDLLRRTAALFIRKPDIYGLDCVDWAEPAIFTANHLGVFGPVLLSVHLPFKFVPWVTHQIADPELCPIFLRDGFIRTDLGIAPPLSTLLAGMIGRISVAVMAHLEAIPIQKNSRNLVQAVARTIEALEHGRRIMIFPEVDYADPSGELQTGFVNVARRLQQRTGRRAVFYPLCISRKANSINIGRGIAYDPGRPFQAEKRRIVFYLKESILLLGRVSQGTAEAGWQPLNAAMPASCVNHEACAGSEAPAR